MDEREEFKSYRLNTRGLKAAELIALHFNALMDDLETNSGCDTESRAFALARTNLEQACFFAKKSMAQRPEMQEGA